MTISGKFLFSDMIKYFLPTLLVSLFLLAGCSPPKSDSDDSESDEGISSEADCNDWLDSAFDMLKPDRLAISAEPDAPVTLLNQWTQSCIDPDLIQLTQDEENLKGYLSGEILARTLNPRFDTTDAMHIRDNLLYNLMAKNISEYKTEELEQVVATFNYVVRNVSLKEKHEPDFPMRPFQVLIFGRGDVEYRTWIFCNILRQLKFDCVLISNPEDQSKTRPYHLVGVILDSGIYLFDPLLGIPIPGKSDNPEKNILIKTPATLTEVVSNPELLSSLATSKEEPYPFTVEKLKNPAVYVVGNSSFYSDRMRSLQFSLGGDKSVVMSDSLTDNDAGDGLLTRVGEAGKKFWNKDKLKDWGYIEEQYIASNSLTDNQKRLLTSMMSPVFGPIVFKVKEKADKDGMKEIYDVGLSQKQLKSRVQHLMGNLPAAIQMYQDTQVVINTEIFKPSLKLKLEQNLQIMHSNTILDGMVWRGICSYELDDKETALSRYLQYMQGVNGQGKWASHCRILISQVFAEVGNNKNAVALLTKPSKDSVYYPAAKFWYRRWAKDTEPESKEKDKEKTEKSDQPKSEKKDKKESDKKEIGKKEADKKSVKTEKPAEKKPAEKTEKKDNKELGKKESGKKTEKSDKPAEKKAADKKAEKPEPKKPVKKEDKKSETSDEKSVKAPEKEKTPESPKKNSDSKPEAPKVEKEKSEPEEPAKKE